MTKALQRIHHPSRGFIAADFAYLKPNTVVVEAIDPPATLEGLFIPTPGSSLGLKSTRYLYRVVAMGARAASAFAPGETALWPDIGSIIVPRNAMFDPLGLSLFSLDVRHVMAIVDPGVLEEREG